MQEIDYIIAKVLSQEATDSEVITFEEWIEKNEDNLKRFLEIKAYWNSHIKLKHSVSSESGYELLIKKINSGKAEKKRSLNRKIIYVSTTVAAIAACIVALFYIPGKLLEKEVTSFYEFKTTTQIDTIILPDQSKVILNKYSNLTYSNHFNEKNRIVHLKGEALFDVSRNETIPFIVRMDSENKITVLGTTFNVNSYTERDNINITLFKGSIKFQTEKNQIILSPNQELIFNKDSKQFEVNESDVDFALFWLNGTYKYRSVSLEKLMNILSKIYGVDITIKSKKLAETNISGTFHKAQSLNEVLTIISRSLPIQWIKQNNEIIIYNL